MSGKKVKELRKKQERTLQTTITIDVYSDGGLIVRNVPMNYHQAMNIMQGATHQVVSFFMNHAKAGEVDPMGTISRNKIIVPSGQVLNMQKPN